jgi:hypothetical protein
VVVVLVAGLGGLAVWGLARLFRTKTAPPGVPPLTARNPNTSETASSKESPAP